MKYSALLLAAAFAFTACEDKVDLDLPEGEKFLVVEGFLTSDDRPHNINLTYTSPYFDSSPPPRAADAIVIIRTDEGEETTLQELNPGQYVYPEGGIVGVSYQLEITLADGSRYLSPFELMRDIPPIVAIRSRVSPNLPGETFMEDPDQKYEVLIDAFEPAGLGDYYRWRSIVNGVPRNEPFDIAIASDEFVDGNPILNFDPTFDLYFLNDTVTIIQERISRGLYEFLFVLQQQTAFVGGPFDTPPAPIEGNVKNLNDPERDALGYFAVVARDWATEIVSD